jgi:hypothetical protein
MTGSMGQVVERAWVQTLVLPKIKQNEETG